MGEPSDSTVPRSGYAWIPASQGADATWGHRLTPRGMNGTRIPDTTLVTGTQVHQLKACSTTTVGVRIPPRAPKSAKTGPKPAARMDAYAGPRVRKPAGDPVRTPVVVPGGSPELPMTGAQEKEEAYGGADELPEEGGGSDVRAGDLGLTVILPRPSYRTTLVSGRDRSRPDGGVPVGRSSTLASPRSGARPPPGIGFLDWSVVDAGLRWRRSASAQIGSC